MTAAPQRPSFLRSACLLAVLAAVRMVERQTRNDAHGATAYVWAEHDDDVFVVIEERQYSKDWETTYLPLGDVDVDQVGRCVDNLAAHVAALWADDDEPVRCTGGGRSTWRTS